MYNLRRWCLKSFPCIVSHVNTKYNEILRKCIDKNNTFQNDSDRFHFLSETKICSDDWCSSVFDEVLSNNGDYSFYDDKIKGSDPWMMGTILVVAIGRLLPQNIVTFRFGPLIQRLIKQMGRYVKHSRERSEFPTFVNQLWLTLRSSSTCSRNLSKSYKDRSYP